MSTKRKAQTVAKKLGAEIEVNKTLGFTDVSVWAKEGSIFLANGAICLCDSSATNTNEMWKDLIDRMKLGYE